MATPPYDDEAPPPPPPRGRPPIPADGGFPDILPGGPAARSAPDGSVRRSEPPPPAVATAVGVSTAPGYYTGPDVAKSGTSMTEDVNTSRGSSEDPAPRASGDGGWDPDYDGAKLPESPTADGSPGGSGSSRWSTLSHFVSTLCFMVGSCLYIVVATKDHRSAKHYRTLPEHVRTSDDDAVWMDHNLKKRFEEKQREGGARRLMANLRGLLSGEGDGGIRRERYEEVGGEFDKILGQNHGSSHMRTRPARQHRHLQRNPDKAKTPAEQWYDLDWSDLPPEVQAAYETLLTTEEVWCGEVDGSPIEDYDWIDLSDEMREQAEFLGYTEEIWCEDEKTGEWTCWVDADGDGIPNVPAPSAKVSRGRNSWLGLS